MIVVIISRCSMYMWFIQREEGIGEMYFYKQKNVQICMITVIMAE